MEGRKSSKNTKLYGGGPRSSRISQNPLPSPSLVVRPQYKERVKSAPLGVLPIEEQQTSSDNVKRETQGSEFNSKLLWPLSAPVSDESATHVPYCGNNGLIEDIQEVVLAVLGAPAVGKSTFVRCALDLKSASMSPISSKKVSLEGQISIVRLLELGFRDLNITADHNIHWPKKIGEQNTPVIDGVLALYDVLDHSTITHIPALIEASSNHGLPTVLVSTKSESPREFWEANNDMVEELCSPITSFECLPVSMSAPETHKRCISIILRNIMLKRREPATSQRLRRPRALTATYTECAGESPHMSQLVCAKSKHGRAFSEASKSMVCNPEPEVKTLPLPRTNAVEDSQVVCLKGPAITHGDSKISSRSNPSCDSRKSTVDNDDAAMSPMKGMEDLDLGDLPPKHNDVPIRDSPRDVSTTALDHLHCSDDIQQVSVADGDLLRSQNRNSAETEDDDSKESGVAFEDLVDRLLAQPMSKTDLKFAPIFLCLYRKFASPSLLVEAIVRRFEKLNDRDLPHLTRRTSQSRYLNIVKDWALGYPNDFAHPITRRRLTLFMQGLATSPEHAFINQEISLCLDVVVEDYDMQWACSDKSRSRANTTESFLTISSVQSAASTLNAVSPALTADSSTEDVIEHVGLEKSQLISNSEIPSVLSSSSRLESQSTGSFQTLLSNFENAQRQAQLLNPMPRILLTKIQWHQFMDIPEEEVARELTRIDWIMYCSIRPRDLIRHVSLAGDQKDKCKSLENFNRMIHQFNHVAFWVANVILLRDKPKHRARALEKFMSIAWKLRYLNNYNSLGAVISGINSIAVHRLAQTRELIPASAQKQFMRLEILMGSQKSHSAYRLAWTNTASQRIPFLPLHLRDLFLAEQGNRTYMDGVEGERINWKKFEIMGEVIVGIQRSQEFSYPTITKNEEVQRLVLDGSFCEDEDELYERSIQLEGHCLGENTKRRFNWFQR